MTKVNRKFCDDLWKRPHLRRRFLTSFVPLRDLGCRGYSCTSHKWRVVGLTKRETSRARKKMGPPFFGRPAPVLAAIEIGGAPIRRTNVMALNIALAEDAQIRNPTKGQQADQVFSAGRQSQERSRSNFSINMQQIRHYDTIRWLCRDQYRRCFAHAVKQSVSLSRS